MWNEFKDFAMKGNVVDMAVGIIIGAAFGKIVASFVNDLLMPIVGYYAGGTDFSNLFAVLGDAAKPATLAAAEEAGVAVVKYGVFITTILDFLIVAFSVFIAVRVIKNMQKAEEEVAAPPANEVLLSEIRDLLKK